MAPGAFYKKCNHILAKRNTLSVPKRKNTLDHILKPQSNKMKNKCQIQKQKTQNI